MSRQQIIAAIDEEIGRLHQVRKLLQSSSGNLSIGSSAKTRKERVLSPDARQRISAAQKRRWAKQKREIAAAAKK
jgi:hypothetical protein